MFPKEDPFSSHASCPLAPRSGQKVKILDTRLDRNVRTLKLGLGVSGAFSPVSWPSAVKGVEWSNCHFNGFDSCHVT